ncbi:hypothetical protein A2U01_0095944, partial [Trifolium medium]|nr:hypothetical protein [Trifolium medium]
AKEQARARASQRVEHEQEEEELSQEIINLR